MVTYYDEKGRKYEFISNSFKELTADEIALCYKKRWDIELLFKKLKQNFQLHYFYGENEPAIRTQIWCTLIAQLLITVLQKQNAPQKAFSTVASTIRIHLISMLCVKELIKAEHRYVAKEDPLAGQTDLFGHTRPKRKERKRRPVLKKDGGELLEIINQHKLTSVNQALNSD